MRQYFNCLADETIDIYIIDKRESRIKEASSSASKSESCDVTNSSDVTRNLEKKYRTYIQLQFASCFDISAGSEVLNESPPILHRKRSYLKV